MRSLLRWSGAAAAVAVPGVVVLATFAAWRDQLPGRIATHWSGSPNGAPDGFSSTTASAAWIVGVCLLAVALAVAAVLAGRARGANQRPARAVVATLASLTGLLAGSWVAIGTANLAADDPAQAHLGARLLWFLGLLWGVVPLGLLRGITATEQQTRRPAGPLLPASGEHVEWDQTLSSPLMTGTLAVALGVMVVLAVVVSPWLWIAAVPLALALAVFAQVRVHVDDRGLRLVSGLVRLPIKRISLEQIAHAGSEQIDPPQWGGWGYRVLPGRSALVLRAGPGLVLDLRDGRRFAVTLDDPDAPARLLAGLLASR
ncbi:MAG TPA: hypothetical protein VFR99_04550 [Marmoricola sp.]|nr:hypothetical protein [Marmoricola sp.]